MFSAPQYLVFSAGCCQRTIRLGAGREGQSLQDGCRLFAWKFSFQTQQQGHEQIEKPLSAYVVVCLMPCSDPLSMLCGDLGRPSWLTVPLAWS
ncbi:hypothetical protein TNCV_430291 [Trichonephila clavipes]|nr:hypothetical protein TNCV_430291 [Trichonephila clavipes]